MHRSGGFLLTWMILHWYPFMSSTRSNDTFDQIKCFNISVCTLSVNGYASLIHYFVVGIQKTFMLVGYGQK